MQATTDFDRECEALNALTFADVPDRATPYAVVHGTHPVGWFASFADANRYARQRFEPETYAIGNPLNGPDFLPVLIVTHPMA
jgi:hypothetical protein